MMNYYLVNSKFEVIAGSTSYGYIVGLADEMMEDNYIISALTAEGLANELEELKIEKGV